MRNTLKKGTIGATVLVFVLLGACKNSFLEVPVTGALDASLLSTRAGLDAVLISAYSQVNGRSLRMASPSNWVWGSIRGGEANKGTDPGDYSDINPIQRFETLPTSGVVSDKYMGNFEGVARANAVLKIMKTKGPDVDKADEVNVRNQAKFLRAHFYFEMKRAFGDVPFVDETVDYQHGIEKVKNDVDLWPLIEKDMSSAADSLPEKQDVIGKVNKWAAKAYLAKIYMYQHKFAAAKTLYDDIIANGMTSDGIKYALIPKFSDLYKASNDNNSESIWAYQAAANTGSINNANPEFDLNWPYNTGPDGPGNCCSFFQPTFEMANAFRTTAAGLPYLDGSYNSHELVTDMGLSSTDPFTPDAGPVDPRLDHTIGRRYIPYLDWEPFPGKAWIRNQPNAGPYETKKYVYQKADKGSLQDNSSWTPGYAAMNYTIIRFADVLLMAAEAEIEVGSLAQAMTYTNMVRGRAMNPADFVQGLYTGPGKDSKGADDYSKPVNDYTKNAANYVISLYTAAQFTDQATARTTVQFERRMELAEEGHRFFDLIRWGIAKTFLDSYIAYEAPKETLGALVGASFTVGRDELLPIPQGQIDLLHPDILKQNQGY